MINSERQWLSGIDWQKVVEVNQEICQKEGVCPKERAGFEKARQLWESNNKKTTKLVDALDFLRKISQIEPFELFNNNTMAAVARQIIEPHIGTASKLLKQMLLSTASHYVVGLAKRRELIEVIDYFDYAEGNGQFKATEEKDAKRPEPARDSAGKSEPAGMPLR